MKRAALHRVLAACLILPAVVAGVLGAVADPGALAGGSAGDPSGTPEPALLFPDITFPTPGMDAEDWYERGFALTTGERYVEAVVAYEQAVAADRSLLNAWYYLGDALFREGRYHEALLAFRNATAIDPDFVDAYFYEALVWGQLGLPQEAEEALGRGLEAADRKKAGEMASGSPQVPGPFPLAVSPMTAISGAGVAAALWIFIRQGKK